MKLTLTPPALRLFIAETLIRIIRTARTLAYWPRIIEVKVITQTIPSGTAVANSVFQTELVLLPSDQFGIIIDHTFITLPISVDAEMKI